MIKQVIDGKTYNTETARCLATVELMGYRMDERGRFTTTTPKKVSRIVAMSFCEPRSWNPDLSS